jgi:hypothetical protein
MILTLWKTSKWIKSHQMKIVMMLVIISLLTETMIIRLITSLTSFHTSIMINMSSSNLFWKIQTFQLIHQDGILIRLNLLMNNGKEIIHWCWKYIFNRKVSNNNQELFIYKVVHKMVFSHLLVNKWKTILVHQITLNYAHSE